MKFLAQILMFSIAGVLVSSCFEDPDCISLRNNFVGITFRKLFDRQIDTVGSLGISVSGTDSIFYELIRIDNTIYVPLNVDRSSQSFDFNLLSGAFSMALDYKSQPQFESVDCGPRFVLSDIKISGHNFDSVAVIGTTPLASFKGSNINIYRCPNTNNLKIAFRQLYADDNANGVELKENLNGFSMDYLPVFFQVAAPVGSIVTSLNTGASTTNILIDSKEKGLSTLNLSYGFVPQQLFEVCGTQNFINKIQITGSSNYDIARIQKDSITDPPTTNVLLLRCPKTNLIELSLSGAPATGIKINKVTALYSSEVFYEDSLTTKLVLPLDTNLDQTDFTIEYETGPKQISFSYTRVAQTFHGQCNQTLISEVTVLASDFTTAPLVKDDSIQFPTKVNFEVIND